MSSVSNHGALETNTICQDNFRFALDTCLYDDERTETKAASEITGCLAEDACLPLKDALTFDDLKPNGEDMYGYCTADKKAFLGRQMQSCLTCLHSSDDHVFLSNCTKPIPVPCVAWC